MNIKTRAAALAMAAMLAIGLPLVKGGEGLVLKTYPDIGGVASYCYGETQNPEPGRTYTKAECDALLEKRLTEFGAAVAELVKVPMSPARHAALTSFAYNVGIEAFKRSTLLKRLNAGDGDASCVELLRWVYVKGKLVPGLLNRRQREFDLCRQ